MKFVLLCSAAAVALLTASTSTLALNPQPEPPGKQAHDLNMSVQHNTPAMTAASNNSCGSGQTAASTGGNAAGAPSGTTARNNSAVAGVNTGLMTNVDKCHSPGAENTNTPAPLTGKPPTITH